MEKRTDINKRGRTAGWRVMLAFGLFFALMETVKQIYLWKVWFGGGYDVWYFPFQLCSMPIYLCLIAAADMWGRKNGGRTLSTFLMDYGLLAGILALIVHTGFTEQGSVFLTLHGYVWHIAMIALALWIFIKRVSDCSWGNFIRASIVYLALALTAVRINVLLHPYGDADMFYLSPYHISTQPVSRSVDIAVGRPMGMVIYVAVTIFLAALVNLIFRAVNRKRLK